MCAIIDANVVAEAFSDNQTEAGRAFRDSVDDGRLQLVVGGKLLDELDEHREFRQWRAVASQYGRVRILRRADVQPMAERLRQSERCVSDDEHIIALARASGARLLFSNDAALHDDFKNKSLIDQPRGKVFTTRQSSSLTRPHRQLLNDASLCRASA